MGKGKRIIIMMSIAIFLMVFVIPMVITSILYKQNFGRRYEKSKVYDYKIEAFQGLKREGYVFESDKGNKLQGYHYYLNKERQPKGMIVVAHGFGGGGHTGYMPEIDTFVQGGYDVFAYDITGNGESGGKAVGGMSQGVLDLERALEFVAAQEQFQEMPILLFGHSWGGYSVMSILNKEPNVVGGVALSGFNAVGDILIETGKRMYGSKAELLAPYLKLYERITFGEVGQLTSIRGLEKTEIPMMVIHSKDDETVSFQDNFLLFKEQLNDKRNIQFIELERRGHEPLRTEETLKEKKELNKLYGPLIEKYGSRKAVPEEKIVPIYEKERMIYRQLDSELMDKIIAFYDEAGGYEPQRVDTVMEQKVDIDEEARVNKQLFDKGYERGSSQLKTMTLEEKVGQMLLARCPETKAVESIGDYHLGGYVLFKRDFEGKTEEEVQATLASYQEVSKVPFVVAVDEEGGTVVRISSNPNLVPHKYASPQALDQQGGLQAIREDAAEKATRLKTLGITMNLAPVADISQNPSDYIYPRTLGKDAKDTANYIREVVVATQKEGIAATLKHFPGYGGNVDTHTQIAYDNRPYKQFVEKDYLPFQAGIEEGVQSILVSHNIVEAIDKAYPASLSPKVHEELREVLGFTGIIITDDLEMEAIKGFTQGLHPAVQAVAAGNDMLIVTNFQEAHQEIIKAVQAGILLEEQIDTAVRRLLAWKYSV